MSAFKTTVSVIIKTYDDRIARSKDATMLPLRDVLGETLESLRQQTFLPAEVIVVDSSDGDGIEDVVASFSADKKAANSFNLVHRRLAPEAFTYTYALNIGIAIAQCELVVSLSGDATPANSRWLEELIIPFADSNVAGAYSRHVARPGMRLSAAEKLRLWWRYRSRRTIIRKHDHLFSNASSCMRRALLETYPIDENLKELEDYAWAKMVQDAGYAIVYAGQSEVFHSHDSKTLKTLQRMLYYFWLRIKTDTE